MEGLACAAYLVVAFLAGCKIARTDRLYNRRHNLDDDTPGLCMVMGLFWPITFIPIMLAMRDKKNPNGLWQWLTTPPEIRKGLK